MAKFRVSVGNQEMDVIVDPGGYLIPGEDQPLAIQRIGTYVFSVLHNGRSCKVVAYGSNGSYQALSGALHFEVMVESEREQLLKQYAPSSTGVAGGTEITAPMPALVARVLVNAGDAVVAGQGLIVLEAMKMENEIRAHQAYSVKEIKVEKGMTVSKGDLLIVLE